ncbi:SSU ribosomal protein S4p (S9e) @ SSU ribosomal protein S4p (S9e), zinc-independent [Olavius algarvensis spirochete endosymbiont]|uniref:30S ribosomal protein S4 n=1 Tax=Olavius algarvensis spirochete endosymbiont TaxID=260710 RepID=UPI000F25B7C9|nr:30S ribosomal protein S4 [Olavius algarvensis spirochete endosymbiont]VDA99507.1 SSU ribosomal protein S4p (S9e) @ SSU ribosomal protein S4p (S9e), zinc-independent [Olavius algarvensis spirochete endosymbiont]
MARNTKARGKIVRRLGVNIYGNSKYDRLLKKKPQKPGKERDFRSRGKVSDYGRQLLEKQKLRLSYALSEKQFFNTFVKAKKLRGLTGDNMMILLERRLDNVVYRLGLATTRAQARQFVSHGHIRLNSRRANVPSMVVQVGDSIKVKESESSKKLLRESLAHSNQIMPGWLSIDGDALVGSVERLPDRVDIPLIANEQMVVEFYSK